MKLKDTKIQKTAWDISKDTVWDAVWAQVGDTVNRTFKDSLSNSIQYSMGASLYYFTKRSVWAVVIESSHIFRDEVLDEVREQVNEIEKIP